MSDDTAALMWYWPTPDQLRHKYRKARQTTHMGNRDGCRLLHPLEGFVPGKRAGVQIIISDSDTTCYRNFHTAVVHTREVTDELMHAIAGYSTHELNRLTIMLLGPYSPENWKVISRNRWRFNKIICHREDTKHLYKQPILRISSPKYKPSRDDLKREYKRRVSIWFDGICYGSAMTLFLPTAAIGVPLLVGSAIAWGADAAVTSIRVAIK
jgi:hypothetical protein